VKVVLVTWKDAVADSGWQSVEAEPVLHDIMTIGYLHHENDELICLAGSWGENEGSIETNNRITIPKGWIISRKEIEIED
jgi:hypothetical protein